MNKIVIFLFSFFFLATLSAQEAGQNTPMADAFRSDGKIWVVIAVIVIIFLSIVVWLVSQDRRISSLEKHLKTPVRAAETKPSTVSPD